MTLATKQLGNTDLHLTRAGLGAWAIGGAGWAASWGEQDDKESIAAIHYAADKGINWIDTAAVYGLGHSEKVVGQALAQMKNDWPLVFTKCGLVWDEDDRSSMPKRGLRPESIKRECDASLQRLGVERIDLYQFHWPDELGTPVEESWGAMLELVEQGKVRHPGVSNFDRSLLQRCEEQDHVCSLQPPFSAINRGSAAELLPWAAEHETGVICYSPMQSGILTDTFDRSRVDNMDAEDWRRNSPDFQEPGLSQNLQLRDALKPVAQRHETTVAATAVAWVNAWPGVTAAIVGARRPEQVDGWLGATELELDDRDMEEIATAIADSGAGDGPNRPR